MTSSLQLVPYAAVAGAVLTTWGPPTLVAAGGRLREGVTWACRRAILCTATGLLAFAGARLCWATVLGFVQEMWTSVAGHGHRLRAWVATLKEWVAYDLGATLALSAGLVLLAVGVYQQIILVDDLGNSPQKREPNRQRTRLGDALPQDEAAITWAAVVENAMERLTELCAKEGEQLSGWAADNQAEPSVPEGAIGSDEDLAHAFGVVTRNRTKRARDDNQVGRDQGVLTAEDVKEMIGKTKEELLQELRDWKRQALAAARPSESLTEEELEIAKTDLGALERRWRTEKGYALRPYHHWSIGTLDAEQCQLKRREVWELIRARRQGALSDKLRREGKPRSQCQNCGRYYPESQGHQCIATPWRLQGAKRTIAGNQRVTVSQNGRGTIQVRPVTHVDIEKLENQLDQLRRYKVLYDASKGRTDELTHEDSGVTTGRKEGSSAELEPVGRKDAPPPPPEPLGEDGVIPGGLDKADEAFTAAFRCLETKLREFTQEYSDHASCPFQRAGDEHDPPPRVPAPVSH